ncbi:hypothetical protein [Sphaerospermopsis sp. FACHB-1194]|uniref:hypothetical protein n=1 Tax=Sphaerospermopsis sp. FACHB-1194 TaxID=2692862 RepID=UPI0016810E36|nr:hypothetical protein [Sphaerospermopsis sp. FACHB-1194]MBD2146443.1 hypothetical protein [Sphaerospermopsis sp. FACHB-1194]
MITPETLNDIQRKLEERSVADKRVLEELRSEIRPLKSEVRRINPRTTTSISLVAADGGNNKVNFDPYLFQVVRVVDSCGRQLLLDLATPTTNIEELSEGNLDRQGNPKSALGVMMKDLGIETLWDLSPMIPKPDQENPSPSWVQEYRDLAEWAALYQMLKEGGFKTDTLIVRDGLLRSKIFSKKLFKDLLEKIDAAINEIYRQTKRRVYLVGFSKKSKVLARYRLAFALEGILTQGYPCYVEIPPDIQKKAYIWEEYATGNEAEKFVGGRLFMVRFGSRINDPIWPIDIFIPQLVQTPQIMGSLLADANDGFPVPFYPQCLQKAHEQAALFGFDMEVMEDLIVNAVRRSFTPDEQNVVDRVRLQSDVGMLRYE